MLPSECRKQLVSAAFSGEASSGGLGIATPRALPTDVCSVVNGIGLVPIVFICVVLGIFVYEVHYVCGHTCYLSIMLCVVRMLFVGQCIQYVWIR